MVIFVTEFVIFLKISKQNELEENGFRMEHTWFHVQHDQKILDVI